MEEMLQGFGIDFSCRTHQPITFLHSAHRTVGLRGLCLTGAAAANGFLAS